MLESQSRAAICSEVVRVLGEARKAQGLSMNLLAKKSGLSQAMISILESSQPNPKLDTLLRLADALDLDLGAVIRRATAHVTAAPPTPIAARRRGKPKP